jgi:hypothetical protein
MHEERIDLRPIDSLADPARFEALAVAIGAAAGPELARRATGGGLLAVLGAWAWPTLAAASLAAAVSAAALMATRGSSSDTPVIAGGVVEALELSGPVALWLDGNRGPTTADLVLALEGEGR